jgi:hypothetical protein
MNFFAHGIRFVDRPWFLAGTALPDWLSVINRRVRLRPQRVGPFAQREGAPAGTAHPGVPATTAQLAAGVLQHFEDDRWFHKSRAFVETNGTLGRMYREFVGDDDGFRCGFLGHITCELLLDACLIERNPGELDRYYDALGRLDPARLAADVATLAGQDVDIAPWLPRFCGEQFLRDYAEPSRLAHRLNQVLRRIKLDPLPVGVESMLAQAHIVVRGRVDELLPPSRFAVPLVSEAR